MEFSYGFRTNFDVMHNCLNWFYVKIRFLVFFRNISVTNIQIYMITTPDML